MIVEIYNVDPIDKLLTTRSINLALVLNGIDIDAIEPHQAALSYYRRQQQQQEQQTILEDENEEVYHVGSRELPCGNCFRHHIRLGERPCTPLEECNKNDELRASQHRTAHNIKKLTKSQQKLQERKERERQKLEELKWGFY
jgi:hypothetical protein